MISYLIIGGALGIGAGIGWVLSRGGSHTIVAQARSQAARVLDEARQTASLTVREMEAHAREESLQVRRRAEAQEQQTGEEIALLEERLRKIEARNESREAGQAVHDAALEEREAALRLVLDQARDGKQAAKDRRQAYQQGLEEKVGSTAQQVQARLSEALVEETRAQCADRLRNLEATSSEEFMRQAKRLMGIAMGRYSGHLVSERLASSLPVTPEGVARLTPETLATIEELTGAHGTLNETRELLRFEGADGAARELARRVGTRVLGPEKVRDLPRLIKGLAADLDREIVDMGKSAFKLLGLQLAHPEIVRLVGRLNFRTSYTQNQWQHAIESSFLGGLMAAELGLDVTLARRGTLLHDIGKALTHEVEGSHAVIGAEYARKYGEDELIANAVGSHHGDEPPLSPYAFLVAAADAMSGARPGARREMVETYVDRISDLERIADHFHGVVMAHAVQAGRELRVHVDERQVSDARAAQLSEEIAKKISDEMTFPGQIRITVIREFKAVEVAN
jgi:ribonucrease Y